jgi:hypothetical protein
MLLDISKAFFLLVIGIVKGIVSNSFLMRGTTIDILDGWWPLRNG